MSKSKKTLSVAVLDMQPITPTIGGGRQRLLGLWHALIPELTCEYIGTFDWPGETARDCKLSDTLHETLIPLSPYQFKALESYADAAGNQTIIDSLFSLFASLSSQYVEKVRGSALRSEIVVLEHPWVYPLVADLLHDKTVVYSSQNVEYLLKTQSLAPNALGVEVGRIVALTEASLLDRANLVLCCSTEDKNLFAHIYGTDLSKCLVAPNGVFVDKVTLPKIHKTTDHRRTAIFIGSSFHPNTEAALFLLTLARRFSDLRFVIIGSVGENEAIINAARNLPNVVLTGVQTDEEKLQWLHRAAFAINPMFSGSGTNVKMFDFMASGLPIITTKVGARGICTKDSAGIRVRTREGIADAIDDFCKLDADELRTLGLQNRKWTEDYFSWESISPAVGRAILNVHSVAGRKNTVSPTAVADAPELSNFSESQDRTTIFVSTYGVKCGIAGYTEALVSAYTKLGKRTVVIAAETPTEKPQVAQRLIDKGNRNGSVNQVVIGWRFDNQTWSSSYFDVDQVKGLINSVRTDKLLSVQYHPAFFPVSELVRLLSEMNHRCLSVSTTLHNSAVITDADLRRIFATGSKVFVHDDAEMLRLRSFGPVRRTDIGISDISHSPSSTLIRDTVIGTFGFLRPHKGTQRLIEAMKYIREVRGDVRLRALCALYPSEDSKKEHEACTNLIDRLNANDYIELDTSFQTPDAVLRALAQCKVLVLPYEESSEGSSAAASTCLGARRPLIGSKSRIFLPLRDVIYRCSSTEPRTLALAVLNFLSNPCVLSHYEMTAAKYASSKLWTKVAIQFDRELAEVEL